MKPIERELVVTFRDAKSELKKLKEATTQAQLKCDKIESELLELLRAQDKDATARYEGLGFVGVNRPAVYASYKEGDRIELLKFLRSRKRQDLIKQTVNARSLSSFVKELLDGGKKIPDCINYYLKTGLRFYGPKT